MIADDRGHVWVAGIMYVDSEDVAVVAETRRVECTRCGHAYPCAHDCLPDMEPVGVAA